MQTIKLNPVAAGFSLAGMMFALGFNQPAAKANSYPAIVVSRVQHDGRLTVEGQLYSQAAPLMEYVETNAVYGGRPTGGRSNGGGGSRGPCNPETGSLDLIALVPTMQPDAEGELQESVLNLTTEAQPTIWVYLPYELDGNLTLEMALNDESGNPVEEAQFVPIGSGPGIVSIPISQEFALVEGERYQWFLNTLCNDEETPEEAGSLPEPPPYVGVWIERVKPSATLERQLAGATPRDQAALYANNGIWQDALTFVAERYRDQPQNPEAQADWVSLIESGDFDDAAEALLLSSNLVDCFTLMPIEGDRP